MLIVEHLSIVFTNMLGKKKTNHLKGGQTKFIDRCDWLFWHEMWNICQYSHILSKTHIKQWIFLPSYDLFILYSFYKNLGFKNNPSLFISTVSAYIFEKEKNQIQNRSKCFYYSTKKL